MAITKETTEKFHKQWTPWITFWYSDQFTHLSTGWNTFILEVGNTLWPQCQTTIALPIAHLLFIYKPNSIKSEIAIVIFPCLLNTLFRNALLPFSCFYILI